MEPNETMQEPNETMLEIMQRHLHNALAGFSTRERALAGAIARAFHNAAEEASKGPEGPEPQEGTDPSSAT